MRTFATAIHDNTLNAHAPPLIPDSDNHCTGSCPCLHAKRCCVGGDRYLNRFTHISVDWDTSAPVSDPTHRLARRDRVQSLDFWPPKKKTRVPSVIAVGTDGVVYVADTWIRRVQLIVP